MKNRIHPALGIVEPVFLNSLPIDVDSEIRDFFMNNNGILSKLFDLNEDGAIPNMMDLQQSFSLPPEVRVLIDSINRQYPPQMGAPSDAMAFDMIIDRSSQYGQELDPYTNIAREILSRSEQSSEVEQSD